MFTRHSSRRSGDRAVVAFRFWRFGNNSLWHNSEKQTAIIIRRLLLLLLFRGPGRIRRREHQQQIKHIPEAFANRTRATVNVRRAREGARVREFERGARGDVLLDKEIMRINHRFGRFPRPVLFLVCPAITIKHYACICV